AGNLQPVEHARPFVSEGRLDPLRSELRFLARRAGAKKKTQTLLGAKHRHGARLAAPAHAREAPRSGGAALVQYFLEQGRHLPRIRIRRRPAFSGDLHPRQTARADGALPGPTGAPALKRLSRHSAPFFLPKKLLTGSFWLSYISDEPALTREDRTLPGRGEKVGYETEESGCSGRGSCCGRSFPVRRRQCLRRTVEHAGGALCLQGIHEVGSGMVLREDGRIQ